MKESIQFLVLVENPQSKFRKQFIVSDSQVACFVRISGLYFGFSGYA